MSSDHEFSFLEWIADTRPGMRYYAVSQFHSFRGSPNFTMSALPMSSLPRPYSTLVGRERDVAAILEKLAFPCRSAATSTALREGLIRIENTSG